MLFKFGKVTPQCSFCKLHDETFRHLFYDCFIVKRMELTILNHLLLISKFAFTMQEQKVT